MTLDHSYVLKDDLLVCIRCMYVCMYTFTNCRTYTEGQCRRSVCVVDVIASRGERLELLVDKTEDLSNNVRASSPVVNSSSLVVNSSSLILPSSSLVVPSSSLVVRSSSLVVRSSSPVHIAVFVAEVS